MVWGMEVGGGGGGGSWGEMESEPMLTPREKSSLPQKLSSVYTLIQKSF